MIFVYMDEVGFMVCKIELFGFLCFECVGGFVQVIMVGFIVIFIGDKGLVMGCIGIKFYYFVKGDECMQLFFVDKLWIDIGVKDKDDVIWMGIQVGMFVILYNLL